jgi:hypothetical protein
MTLPAAERVELFDEHPDAGNPALVDDVGAAKIPEPGRTWAARRTAITRGASHDKTGIRGAASMDGHAIRIHNPVSALGLSVLKVVDTSAQGDDLIPHAAMAVRGARYRSNHREHCEQQEKQH